MDGTGMKLNSENDVSGWAAEALVITLKLEERDNTHVNHYIVHTASVHGEHRNILNSGEKKYRVGNDTCPPYKVVFCLSHTS